jgi:hypothetical protein
MAIKPNAGQLRGVRAVRDPEQILLDPFADLAAPPGGYVGYVIVYGERSPAVYDGTRWHPITDETEEEWNAALQERIVKQGTAISEAAQRGNEVYVQLAGVMQVAVGENTSGTGNDPIVYFGA